jgi:hypothetical protein
MRRGFRNAGDNIQQRVGRHGTRSLHSCIIKGNISVRSPRIGFSSEDMRSRDRQSTSSSDRPFPLALGLDSLILARLDALAAYSSLSFSSPPNIDAMATIIAHENALSSNSRRAQTSKLAFHLWCASFPLYGYQLHDREVRRSSASFQFRSLEDTHRSVADVMLNPV